MERELVAFMCITMSLTSFAGHKENWNFKEQKDIKVIERVGVKTNAQFLMFPTSPITATLSIFTQILF